MIQHLELVQESRRRLTEVEFSHHGRVISMRNTQCECSLVADCSEVDRSRFIRVCESFPDLTGPQLEALNELCLAARHSEDFFITVNATNQWLRTVVGHEDLHPATWTEAETWSRFMPSVVIHSNILPYDPFWSKLWGGDGVHFSSCLLKEALKEKKTLKTKFLEWKSSSTCAGEGWKHGRLEDGDMSGESKLFWEIQAADVKFVKELARGSDGIISLITWRGGRFVRKEPKELQTPQFDAELEVVKRISHPHIIYSFGAHHCDGPRISSSYFMEYMTNDLFNFIFDRVHCSSVGDNQPPFSPHESVDVLLQIAKAMRYMHDETVNVVHCDLKSLNILLSEIAPSHYLVKVADFGSAQLATGSEGGFVPGAATTNYAAPEVLRRRSDESVRIDSPHKVDVYSFGIVAFEVLTGKNNHGLYKRSPSRFKKDVIDGTVRPPLRDECQEHKEFSQDKDLISLIELCWHGIPSKRPSFAKICEELVKARVRISEQMLQRDDPKCQANSVKWQSFKFLHGPSAYIRQIASSSRDSSR